MSAPEQQLDPANQDPPAPEDPPTPPSPETVLRTARQAVDEALSAVASADVEAVAGSQRVADLEADLARARAQAAAGASAKLAMVRGLHGACDQSIAAIEAVKAAHPLP